MIEDGVLTQSDTYLLFQQVGEVLSGVRGLHDIIDIRQAQAEQLHDIVRADLASLRRDQRELEERLDCLMGIAQQDVDRLRTLYTQNAKSIETLISAIDGFRQPIREVLALKSRLVSTLLAISALGSSALWLAEPIYRWFVDKSLGQR